MIKKSAKGLPKLRVGVFKRIRMQWDESKAVVSLQKKSHPTYRMESIQISYFSA